MNEQDYEELNDQSWNDYFDNEIFEPIEKYLLRRSYSQSDPLFASSHTGNAIME